MTRPGHRTAWCLLAAVLPALSGCNVTSYFDPSKTGRYEDTPTTIPILDRIDVIEREPDPWANATLPTPDDLLPSDLTYRLAAGDVITVEIFELMVPGEVWSSSRRIDASGYFRLPAPLGDVPAAGLTPQEFQDEVTRLVDERVMRSPLVNVVVEQGAGFSYTLYGALASPGVYTLLRADHRLLDALAMAGGVPIGTQRIFVIRQVPLDEKAIFQPARPPAGPSPITPQEPPVSIEDLINRLEQPEGSRPQQEQKPSEPPIDVDSLLKELDRPISTTPSSTPRPPETEPKQTPPIDIEDLIDELGDEPTTPDSQPPPDVNEPEKDQGEGGVHIAPGFYQEKGPPIDIEQLEPIRVPDAPPTRPTAPTSEPPADTSTVTAPAPVTPAASRAHAGGATPRVTYRYDPDLDEWVAVKTEVPPPAPPELQPPLSAQPSKPIFVERIIEIPYDRLKRGDSAVNIVIRPKDRIYIAEPRSGVIYVDGEIARPGVYSLPLNGKITLSRLVAAAGGLGPLAIPERVDLTRIVAPNREANIRLNLGAIRRRTQPDLYLKPDDHILIGTDFWAVPLAVFRNGLRMTYGFGFLLDRNFGNDVFGPPPVNVVGR
jgi:protein involved in polysaccharide export with SLBB domain